MYYMFWECTNLTSLDLTGFTFIEGVDCSAMLGRVGMYAASDSKTPIYVTQAGNEYLSKQQTNIDENYAELKVIETSAE